MNGITWLASYPKSGNTWMRIFLTNLNKEDDSPAIINDLSIPNFSDRQWWDGVLGWNSSDFVEDALFETRLDVQEAIARTEDRMFKTHDAFAHPASKKPLFSGKATKCAIYIIRNPLDVVLSFANHLGQPIEATVAKMNDMDGRMADNSSGARLQVTQFLGDWSWHVRSWIDDAGIKVHVMRYEDMLAEPESTFAKACAFIGLNPEPEKIRQALQNSKFEVLREQEQAIGFSEKPRNCPQFFSSGRAERWREDLKKRFAHALCKVHGPTMERFGYATI